MHAPLLPAASTRTRFFCGSSLRRAGRLPFLRAVAVLAAGTAQTGAAAELAGWWPFNGNYNDATGNGLNGTVMGEPTFDAGLPTGLTGQSVLFNDDAEGVRIAANEALNAAEFTLGYFINLQGMTPGNGGLERLTGRDNYEFETAVGSASGVGGNGSPTGLTLSYYSPPLAGGWQVTNVEIPADGWVHVVWRNSATEMLLYLNGEQVYTGPPVTATFEGYMNFGTAYTNREGFEGLMHDAFYAGALLTPEEIALVAEKGVGELVNDTDADGLPNSWETKYGLDPADSSGVNGADGHKDDDGLTNKQEFDLGTDPTKVDTDGDGLKDGEEVTLKTNPLVVDTDADGLPDGQEVTLKTNPLSPDTDGDGANDADELAGGSDPLDDQSLPPSSAYLVLWLKFEGDAQDSSLKANHGTLLESPEFVNEGGPGGGNALYFTSNTMGVTVPGNNMLSSQIFTLSYWAKPTTLQEGAGLERLTSRAGDLFETAIGNRSALGGVIDLTLSYFQGAWVDTGVALVQDEWAHVAWRCMGDGPEDMTLWVNGIKVYTGQGLPAGRPGSGVMNIGNRANSSEGFEGAMDDIRLYRAALRDTEMAGLAVPATGSGGTFEITGTQRAANGGSLTLKFTSRANRTYAVDYCTDLRAAEGTPGSWVELTDSVASGGAETQYVDNVASNLPRAFYRVRDVTSN